MNPVLKVIHERRSIRSYKSEQITKEHLNKVLDAGLWAPTARNEQEILFVAIQDTKILEELQNDFVSFASDASRIFYYGAPTFIMLFGPRNFAYTDIDGGIAVQNMALAAESLGLNSVIIGIIRKLMESNYGTKWFNKFCIPLDYKFVIGIALGIKLSDTPKRDRKEGRIILF